MKRFLHRSIFIAGISIFYGIVFIGVFFPKLDARMTGRVKDTLIDIVAAFLWYFVVSLFYTLYKLIKARHRRKILWLLIILLLPFIGVYLYFERHIVGAPVDKIKPTTEKLEALIAVQAQKESEVVKLMQKRFAAFIFDYLCFAILFSAYLYLFRTRTESGFQVVGLQHLAILLVAWFLWIPFIESRTGQTVGKKFLRITVVNSSGEKPSLEECVKRHVLDMLDIIFLALHRFCSSRTMPCQEDWVTISRRPGLLIYKPQPPNQSLKLTEGAVDDFARAKQATTIGLDIPRAERLPQRRGWPPQLSSGPLGAQKKYC